MGRKGLKRHKEITSPRLAGESARLEEFDVETMNPAKPWAQLLFHKKATIGEAKYAEDTVADALLDKYGEKSND